ncbi:MAG: hypothetical protein KC800_04875, partial [Candidatus Eremiobacteraeota bacterium]|nr:hypothetical protein [Candidatus Eremiobacteraeota bacterium]
MRATNRGIVIVSILVLTLLATFFMGALVQMNPSRLRRNVHDENRDRASMAARAGVDYVLNRFKSDVDWAADANMKTVEMEDLVIREDHGNVLGWIRAEDGTWAGFRVRFNAQDGDDGFDERPDPTYPIDNDAISLNNLDVPDSRAVPKATSGSVSTGSTEPGDVNTVMVAPANSIALQVEGIVSPDLRPDDPAGLAQAEDVTMRTVEGIFVISQIVAGRDDAAVLSSGADSEITVGSYKEGKLDGVLSLQSDSDNVAGIRSKGKLDLQRGQGSDADPKFDPDEDAEVRTNPSAPFSEELADGTTFKGGSEEKDATFLKIEWDKVKNSEQTDALKLPGGVYIFSDGDSDSGRSPDKSVKYFDMSWPQYKAALLDSDPSTPVESAMPAGFLDMVELDQQSVALTRNDGVGGDVSNEKRDIIKVTGDISIEDPDGKGFTIVPERGARQKAGTDSDSGDVDPPSWDSGEAETNTTTVTDTLSSLGGWDLTPGGEFNIKLTDGSSIRAVDINGTITYQPANAPQIFWQEAVSGNQMILSGAGSGTYPVIDGANFYKLSASESSLKVNDIQAFAAFFGIQGAPGPANDPLHIPEEDPVTGLPISLDGGPADKTVPQDIEVVFEPGEGNDTAFIRSETDIFLGTHLSGEGGGVISNKKVNLIGFGINIDARTDQTADEQKAETGVAIYGKDGINISTYDERRNNYWDVEVAGAVFTEGNIMVRLGEDKLSSGEDPPWGLFNYEGSMTA